MTNVIHFKGCDYAADQAYDISSGFRDGHQLNCYYAPPFASYPVVAGSFIGDTSLGGPVNYRNIHLNPHGNGTHTECAAHIGSMGLNIRQVLQSSLFRAQLLTVAPLKQGTDSIISLPQIADHLATDIDAVIIRTSPNNSSKLLRQYSGTNPPYMVPEIGQFLAEQNIQHLLVDLPSVDREEDGGLLLMHRAFWQYPGATRISATITELIYVDNAIPDGMYLLNLQIAPFELDAAPSRPMIHPQV